MTAETIPAFVFRGLATLHGPELNVVHWRTEADIRDSLAAYLWFAGVESVRTEVQVADCGRIDVLAEEGQHVCVIEIKRSLATVSAARKAYQQADTYRRYIEAEHVGEDPYCFVHAVVTASDWHDSVVTLAGRAFSEVQGYSYSEVLGNVMWCGFPEVTQGLRYRDVRRPRIADRRRLVERLLIGLDVADREWAAGFERTSLRDAEQVA